MNEQITEEKNKKLVRDFIEQNNIKLPKNKRRIYIREIIYNILIILVIVVNISIALPQVKDSIPEKFIIEKVIEKKENYHIDNNPKYCYEILVRKANDKNNNIYKGRTNYHKLGKIKEKEIIYGKINSEGIFLEDAIFLYTLSNNLMPSILLLFLMIIMDIMIFMENGHFHDKQLKKRLNIAYLNNLKISKDIAMQKASYETNKNNEFYISIFIFMFIIFLIICMFSPTLVNFISFALTFIITMIISIYKYAKEEKKLLAYRDLEMDECIESIAIDHRCYMEASRRRNYSYLKWFPYVTVYVDNKFFRVQCTLETYICILHDPHVYVIKYVQNGVLKNVKVFSIYDYS